MCVCVLGTKFGVACTSAVCIKRQTTNDKRQADSFSSACSLHVFFFWCVCKSVGWGTCTFCCGSFCCYVPMIEARERNWTGNDGGQSSRVAAVMVMMVLMVVLYRVVFENSGTLSREQARLDQVELDCCASIFSSLVQFFIFPFSRFSMFVISALGAVFCFSNTQFHFYFLF